MPPLWFLLDGGLQRAVDLSFSSRIFYSSGHTVGPGKTFIGEGRMREDGSDCLEPKALVTLSFQAPEQKALGQCLVWEALPGGRGVGSGPANWPR